MLISCLFLPAAIEMYFLLAYETSLLKDKVIT